MKPKIIVIAFNGFNSYGMVRCLGEVGIKPYLILPKNDIQFVAKSKWAGPVKYFNDKKDISEILFENFGKEKTQPIVINCEDHLQAEIDLNFDKLSQKFQLSNCKTKQGEISRLMDKDIQLSIAEESGLSVPKSWHKARGNMFPSDLLFPIIAKPFKSIEGSKADIRICYSESELKQLDNNKEYTLQQFIEKDYEIILWGTSVGNGKYYIPGVTRKIRQFPNEWGLSSYCVLESFDKHPELKISDINNFLKKLGYTGMFSIEMAVKNGKYYFLEINLRNDGKQYFAAAAGANLPLIYIRSLLGEEFKPPLVKFPTYAMGELTDVRQVLRGKVGFFHWLLDLIRTKCFFVLNFGDIKPFIYQQYQLRFHKKKMGLR
ncbi:MAG: hypothetical protein NC453_12485 [Muribaculum sp.]|nr:hypothetical protein [Muribaculum sp.]